MLLYSVSWSESDILDLLVLFIDIIFFGLGRGNSMSREDRNDAKEGVDKGFETDNRVLKKRKKEKRVQNQNNSTEDDLGLLFGDGITGKLPRFANKITVKVCSCSFYYLFFKLTCRIVLLYYCA